MIKLVMKERHLNTLQNTDPVAFRKRLEGVEALQSLRTVVTSLHKLYMCLTLKDPSSSVDTGSVTVLPW
jgi:hypothetical protein